MHSQALQLVKIQCKGPQAVFQEPVQLRTVHGLHGLPGLLGGGIKFRIACLLLFQTLDMGAEFIRSFYKGQE